MVYVFCDCELDSRLYGLRRAGEQLKLEPKVFEVLVYLIGHRDRFVSRNELLEKLWPGQVVVDAVLTQCIAKARKAVGDDGGKQQVIKTQHGRGYRFVAEVTERSDSPLVPRQQPAQDDNRDLRLQFLPQTYWQRRQLALVGTLLALVVLTTIWHFSFHRSLPPAGTYPEKGTRSSDTILAREDQRPLWFLSTNSPEASAYGLRGWDYYYRYAPEANTQARNMFERAIASDPRYAAAYVGLGWTYVVEWTLFWSDDAQSLDHAFAVAQEAIVLNDMLSHAHALLASVYVLKRQYEHAISEAERAVALDPACAECYVTLAEIWTFVGRSRKAIELVERARYLNPSAAANYAATSGWAYYLIGQPELAIPALKRALIRNPNVLFAHLHLALAYSELDLTKAAQAELRTGQKLTPQLSLERLKERLPHNNPQTVERLLRALRKAGLK
jgi:DNA-binding winged helix-turn-helix (wHTH) protein/tetratricopeptide (TPR) repeat protein